MYQLNLESFDSVCGGNVRYDVTLKLTDNAHFYTDGAFFGQNTFSVDGISYPDVFSDAGVVVDDILVHAKHPEDGTTVYDYSIDNY